MNKEKNESSAIMRGMITRGVGGLYGVRVPCDDSAAGEELLARARGVFRLEKLTPTVGDTVTLRRSADGEDCFIPGEACDGKNHCRQKKNGQINVDYVIESIEERKNILIRPPLSNLDYLFAVIPCASPEPDLLTADKLTSIAENCGIETVVIVNKSDLSPTRADEIAQIYRTAGYTVFTLSSETGDGIDALEGFIRSIVREGRESGKNVIGAFAGASGAGKSTLMTRLFPTLELKTGAVSRKTERGRHTTRHVELYPAETDAGILWIADTPGFSMLDFTRFDFFPYDDLALSFREFGDCLGKCRYTKCTHLCEEGCAVIEKMRSGLISGSRHESYKRIFEEQRSVPEWKRRQEQKERL